MLKNLEGTLFKKKIRNFVYHGIPAKDSHRMFSVVELRFNIDCESVIFIFCTSFTLKRDVCTCYVSLGQGCSAGGFNSKCGIGPPMHYKLQLNSSLVTAAARYLKLTIRSIILYILC